MKRQVNQNVVDFVANFITDDAEIFAEGHPRAQTSPLPAPPAPPTPGKKSSPRAKTSSLPAPPAPHKAPKKRHPLPKPKYPGSEGDKQAKARQKRIDGQKEQEKYGRNRSPFGDSLNRALDQMMSENMADLPAGTHNPDPDTEYHVEALSRTDNQDQWRISGNVNGVLTVFHDAGVWDGYDWDGDPIDGDTLQRVLDLFENEYEVDGDEYESEEPWDEGLAQQELEDFEQSDEYFGHYGGDEY